MDNKEQPSFWSVIPAEVRYDNELTPAQKVFYAEITSLTSKSGVCWASNKYFARLYDVYPSTVSRWVKALQNKKYISVNYIKEGEEIKQRRIELNQYPSVLKQAGIVSKQERSVSTTKLIVKANNKKDNNKNIIPSTKANKLGKSRGILSSEEFDNIMK